MVSHTPDGQTSPNYAEQHKTAATTHPDEITVREAAAHLGRVAQLAADVLRDTEPSHNGRLVYFALDDDYNAHEVAVLDITPANMARILGCTLDQRTAAAVADKVREIDQRARFADEVRRIEDREALRASGQCHADLATRGYLDRTHNGELTLAFGGQR